MSRQPFQEVLAEFLRCAPTASAILDAARKSPDRWTQALSILARLAGYHEKLEIEGIARVTTMSDSEIDARIAAFVAARLPATP